ncbi:MAG: DUF4215 domain-containing protein [Deltaproteobacteria bacterium]|nr:DUF4215 domain-containing protein [Deltaproteobacteria bacterium]
MPYFKKLFLSGSVAVLIILISGCETDVSNHADIKDTESEKLSGDTDTVKDTETGTDSEKYVDTSGTAPKGCGDGTLSKDEACDDGNTESGDGCSANCLYVAEGYTCNPPGQPCRLMAICGDGQKLTPELCDDGNTDNGDGCSDLCQVEIGYKCSGSPSSCDKTVCGDGKVEGAEGCDDSNPIPFDGCDDRCQVEANCTPGVPCSSVCGDGLVLGEECDDGNNLDGDGCSSQCKVESGYKCIQPEVEGDLLVPIVYKDFNFAHPDFEVKAGCDNATPGMVETTLGTDGKPVFKGSLGDCARASQFNDWYDYTSTDGSVVVTTLKLFSDEKGGYVNRWLEDGTSWQSVAESWCDNVTCSNCSCAEACGTCSWGGSACCQTFNEVAGQPFFFPLDGKGITPISEYTAAAVGPIYSGGGYPSEADAIKAASLTPPSDYVYSHNFSFTSQVKFWFEYHKNVKQVLNFVGDDDVWVFINGKLAVDLGGLHAPVEGEIDVSTLGLTDGEVYDIEVFQAERLSNGSTYRLTLSGFNVSRSECRPDCGDGVVGLGEQCDDGVNDGGYGECAENCKLGEYCGDGIKQAEFEDCDDGNFIGDDDCPASCRLVSID